jgi:hypothetical protein
MDGCSSGLIEVLFWTDEDHRIPRVLHQVVSWGNVVGIVTRLQA